MPLSWTLKKVKLYPVLLVVRVKVLGFATGCNWIMLK